MRQKQGKERYLTAEGLERLKPYHDYFVKWDRSKVLSYPGATALRTIHEVYTGETGDRSVRLSLNCGRCMEELMSAATPVYLDTLEKASEPIIVEADKETPKGEKKVQQKPRKRANTKK